MDACLGEGCKEDVRRAGAQRTLTLGRLAADWNTYRRHVHYVFCDFGVGKAVKDPIHSVLHAGLRTMELPRGLRDQVAEHVPGLHPFHSPEYQMRTHV